MTPLVDDWLRSQGMFTRREVWMPSGVCDLVGCCFDEEHLRTRFATGYHARTTMQSRRDAEKGRPWLPLHKRLVFVELKLSRRAEVWRQAQGHHSWGETYVAMPHPACDYRPPNEFMCSRVGVLRVDGGVMVLRPAAEHVSMHPQALRVVDSMALEYGLQVGLGAIA